MVSPSIVTSFANKRPVVVFATVITSSEQPGQPIVVSPGPSLPAANTVTTPASCIASSTSSYTEPLGLPPAPPPHELLTTSAPSVSAASSIESNIEDAPLEEAGFAGVA